MKTTSMLQAVLMLSGIGFGSGHAFAAWEQRAIDTGGIPGEEIAISSATSKAYIPLLAGGRALAVFDGVAATTRMELSIRPSAVGYSAATGRLFVAGMFDNAVVAIDEATGDQIRIDVGAYPDNVLVDDVRGKVYVSRWGGLGGQGGVAVIDSRTLALRDVALGGAITGMVQDRETGNVFVTGESIGSFAGFIAALDPEGNVVARHVAGYQAYSLAVDSRNGRVYLGALSGSPMGGAVVTRVFTIYSQPGLQVESQVEWPTGRDLNRLVFIVDPAKPGLYFSSGGSTTLLRVDADGSNLRTWPLPLGDTVLEDGRTVINGIFGLNADPGTGRIFASSPVGSRIAVFDPQTAATEIVSIPGAVGFSAVHFWPDSGRMIVTDGMGDRQLTLLQRAATTP